MIRRAALLWLVAFALYASTIGLHAFGASEYGGDEPHHLMTAISIAEDGSPDLLDEYRSHAYSSFYPYELRPRGVLTGRSLDEPHGVGFPLLIAPAWAVGGTHGVELFLAAIAALAVVLAYLLALRAVPDPWALGATVAVAASPPWLAYATTVSPEIAAGAALAGAALLALRMDEHPSRRTSFACFLLLSTLPWLGLRLVPAGIVVGAIALRGLRSAGRRWVTLVSLEVPAVSIAIFVSVNNNLYGGPSPQAAELGGAGGTGASFPGGYLDRAYRLVALLIDREAGLVRWAPVLALAFVGTWLLLRERQGRLARAIPALRREERAVTVCALAAGAQLLVAAFIAPTMFGFWFPGRNLIAVLPLCVPLVALGLRRAPRAGAALALLTVAGSAWLYADLRWGGGTWINARPDAPWGPLERVFPLFREGSTIPFVVAAVLGAAAIAALFAAVSRSRWGAIRAP
ncbi:MAG: hypothetical protein QOE06_609 [Thermoleophilaceae bacterium]|nr:hypothetical protein [Thermoleophilaceae bacterium]